MVVWSVIGQQIVSACVCFAPSYECYATMSDKTYLDGFTSVEELILGPSTFSKRTKFCPAGIRTHVHKIRSNAL